MIDFLKEIVNLKVLFRVLAQAALNFADMKEFLRQVAVQWLDGGGMEDLCFIFPNRRSLAFFRKYLSESVKERGGAPFRSPALFTMNDFFYKVVGAYPSSRVKLLLELHRCYNALIPKEESLDEFIFWGDVILSDFDDVDKYLVNPEQLFTNVSDLKNIQDTYSYLTEGQREAVERFLSHFRSGGSLKENASGQDGAKGRFLQVWDILYRLYRDFNSSLDGKGMSYEGKVYRRLAGRLDDEPAVDILAEALPDARRYVFVGLNALNECEKKLMRRMRDAGVAEFCWDWSEDAWISDRRNKSTVFMEDNLAEFGNAVRLEGCSPEGPEINVLSVPSSVGQAKQLPLILERMAAEEACGDISALGIDTAVILPDESLLIPVLNSIPPDIKDINVTMGYPMGESGIFQLLTEAAALQMHLRCKEGRWHFYYRQAYSIFSNSVFKASIGDDARKNIDDLKKQARYYIPQSDFADDPVMNAVFKPVVRDPKAADPEAVRSLGDYLKGIVMAVAMKLKEQKDMVTELDFARECCLALNSLRDEELPVLPATFIRLLSQLLASQSVPFNGEPLNGLQIMGPLETRTLDFRNLVILSANEGVFPRRSVSSSFIPPELRKGFGLPTYEYQDAVWAYYFYRMLLRAENVWLLCDSRSEGLKSGEESRYIKQLELHFRARINRFVAKAPALHTDEGGEIVKTQEDVDIIKDTLLSATALQNYLYCPAKFYYHTVRKLKPDDEVSESLDAGMIGNVFHHTMLAIYSGEWAMDPSYDVASMTDEDRARMQKYVTRDYVKSWLARPDGVKARIRSLIMSELHSFEVSGRNLVFENVVFEYVMKVLMRDLECMEEYGTEAFEVLGLELPRKWEYDGFRFIGFIDRMDRFRNGEVRVVDYKTGKVEDADINISDDNAEKVVEKLFGPSNAGRPKIALQLFLYDMSVSDLVPEGTEVVNSIYSPARLFVSNVESVGQSAKFISLMKDRLSETLREISDVDVPFTRTDDEGTCKYCDFKNICGR